MNLLASEHVEGRDTIIGSSDMVTIAHEIQTQHVAQRAMILNDQDGKLLIGIFMPARERLTVPLGKWDDARFASEGGAARSSLRTFDAVWSFSHAYKRV